MNILFVMLQAGGAVAQEVSSAAAQGEAKPEGNGMMSMLLMMVVVFGLMYLFMIRPQQKRQKELAKFRNSLEKGQKIVTAGGIYGTVKEIKENYVLVEVDGNVTLRVDKSMVVKDNSDLAQGK